MQHGEILLQQKLQLRKKYTILVCVAVPTRLSRTQQVTSHPWQPCRNCWEVIMVTNLTKWSPMLSILECPRAWFGSSILTLFASVRVIGGFYLTQIGYFFLTLFGRFRPTRTILEYLRIFRLDLNGGVHFVILKGITAKCEICGMDIHPNIGYTCHGDSSLYVVIPVCFCFAP